MLLRFCALMYLAHSSKGFIQQQPCRCARYVAVADPTLWTDEGEGGLPYCGSGRTRVVGRPRLAMGGKVLLLMDGDRYDVRTREVLSLGQ